MNMHETWKTSGNAPERDECPGSRFLMSNNFVPLMWESSVKRHMQTVLIARNESFLFTLAKLNFMSGKRKDSSQVKFWHVYVPHPALLKRKVV